MGSLSNTPLPSFATLIFGLHTVDSSMTDVVVTDSHPQEEVDAVPTLKALGQHLEAIDHKLHFLEQLLTTPQPSLPLSDTPTPSLPSPTTLPLAAVPSAFNGDRSKGLGFLAQCQLYLWVYGSLFTSDRVRILWALSYMKEGRAALFMRRTLRALSTNPSSLSFNPDSWASFEAVFLQKFCPRFELESAQIKLEGDGYHQGSRSVEDYVDEFQDLVQEAGYLAGPMVVWRFRHGLDRSIHDEISDMPVVNRPGLGDLDGWINVATLIDQHRRAHEEFERNTSPLVSTPRHPASPTLPSSPDLPEVSSIPDSGPHDVRRMTDGEIRRMVAERRKSGNRYLVLPVEEASDSVSSVDPPPIVSLGPPPAARNRRPTRPKWERRLPRQYTVAGTSDSKSLRVPVVIETTDTAQRRSLNALLDSGATGLFINADFVRAHRLTEKPLQVTIPVFNVDGTPNDAGGVKSVVDLILRFRDHTERATFAVTNLGHQDMVLGYPWLKEHNPDVDWATGDVRMTRCPRKCSTCRDEVRAEKRKVEAGSRLEIRAMQACQEGPMPAVTMEEEDEEELPELGMDSDGDEVEGEEVFDLDLEGGDRLFMTTIPPEQEFISATSTVSQRLAEAFAANSGQTSFKDSVPSYLHDFEDVFSKTSFDTMPTQKPWDHAIEFEPGSKTNCMEE